MAGWSKRGKRRPIIAGGCYQYGATPRDLAQLTALGLVDELSGRGTLCFVAQQDRRNQDVRVDSDLTQSQRSSESSRPGIMASGSKSGIPRSISSSIGLSDFLISSTLSSEMSKYPIQR